MKKILPYLDYIIMGILFLMFCVPIVFPGLGILPASILALVAGLLLLKLGFSLASSSAPQVQRGKNHQPSGKMQERAQLDLVAKSKTIAEENSRKIARYSAIFVHLKSLVAQSREEQILKTFVELLDKVLHLSRVTFFECDLERKVLVSRYSTDIHLSGGRKLEIPMDEDTVLGHAALHRQGYDDEQVKKNVRIAHLSVEEPVVMKLCVPIIYDRDLLGIVNIGERQFDSFTKEDSQFFATVCNLLGLALQNASNLKLIEDNLLSTERKVKETTELNTRIRELFGKFTSPNVVNALVEKEQEIVIGGESKEISILFSDIRAFTTYCERRAPEEVVDILNEYLTKMSQVILKYDGTLDKYIGDEIMAFWGAPLEQPQHARLALQAGYEMHLELKKLELQWQKQGREPFGIGMGVNTGNCIVGNIGSNLRMDYTVIGDNVNLCSRVQSLTRKFNSNFLITDYTYKYVKDMIKARKIGVLQVKGKVDPVMIFAVEWVDLKPLSK